MFEKSNGESGGGGVAADDIKIEISDAIRFLKNYFNYLIN